MITLAIIGILLSQALPGFGPWVASAKQTSAINRMVAHLHLARSEAIKRGVKTVLCASLDAQTCSKQIQWEHGYILFTDENENKQPDNGDDILQIHSSESTGLAITSSIARTRLTFQPTGMSPGSNVTITFCDTQAKTRPKALIVSNTGRPRVSEFRPDGSPIVCT
jgi:type IV fimbrial biogenesis protein FimT